MPKGDFSGEPLTVEQVEADNLHPDDGRVPQVPFGFCHCEWLRFKEAMQPGDRIHHFRSSPESWEALGGREGYVLVRKKKIVTHLLTVMS